jgi:hypothetical protein
MLKSLFLIIFSLCIFSCQVDTIPFADWFENTEKMVNQFPIKDTVIYYPEVNSVKIDTFSDGKDSFLLVDMSEGIEEPVGFLKKYFLFRYRKNCWQEMEKYAEEEDFWMSQTNNGIDFIDINFDNQKDLVVRNHLYSSRMIIDYRIFLRNQANYCYDSHFLSAYSTEIDTLNKSIITTSDGGNYGTHSKSVNKWINGKLIEITSLGKSYSEKGYIFEEVVYKNQKKRLLKRWTIKDEKKAQEYFDNWQKTPSTKTIEF